MKKIKNFFYWLAWLEHKDSTQSAVIIYGIMIGLLGIIFFPAWIISGNIPTATGIAFGSSVGSGIVAVFVASCFFSNPKKNWRIAVYEAREKIRGQPSG